MTKDSHTTSIPLCL